MATILTSAQKEVIRKIIYAVETGGQKYGDQDYSSLIGAGHNTSNEKAITIGAGQWYATEAKQLLNLIRKTDKATFTKLDTAGIGSDLDTKDWSKYNITPGSAKAKCIVAIISSTIGIKCQDTLMESQITTYATDVQKEYGTMGADAITECINIQHQGGGGALKRILAKTAKPYTAKTIYAALNTDPADKSNNNQVGDYTGRQKKVYEMINTYLIPTMGSSNTSSGNTTNNNGGNKMTENELRSSVANYLKKYIGISEGSTSHKEIINTFNNSGLCSRYTMTTKDAWCATGVSATFIALKLAGKPGSGSLFECVDCSCGFMIQLAQKQGIWVENDAYVPKVGDIVMYYWKDNGVGDCTQWPDHVGIVCSVSGSTFKVIECNISNSVGYRTMSVNGKYIRGFITPKYAKFASGVSAPAAPSTPTNESTANTTTSTSGGLNKTCKWKGYVTASELNVRSWAGTENKVLRKLTKNTAVEVCDVIDDKDGDDWYYIKEGGKYGFVSATYIARSAVSTTPAPTTPSTSGGLNKTCKWKGKVTTSSLNVRSWAGTENASLRKLAKNTVVEVCDSIKAKDGQLWYYIKEGSKYGFVHSAYVART